MKNLTEEQGDKLLKFARAAINSQFCGDGKVQQMSDITEPLFLKNRGTFVTLKLKNQLRGCIGNIEPVKSIQDGISDNAINAAFSDHRFSPLSKEEFGDVHISISVLSHARKLSYDDYNDLLEKLRPYQDGVILRKGPAGATFLPQVWEQLPEKEQFLSHLCLKAGLSASCWRDTDLEILVYQVQSFEEDRR